MPRGLKLGALLAAGVFTLSVWAIAQDRGGWGPLWGRDYMMGGRVLALLESDRVKTELGLTDQQADKLRQVYVDSRKASIRTRAELQVRRMELREMLRDDKPDREAVMKKVQEISDLRTQMMRQHVESLLAAKAVLTPEQQKKMRSFISDRRFGRGEGWPRRFQTPGGRGPGRPGGPERLP